MGQAMLKRCSVCQKTATEKFMPFCSARCAQIDLGRWLGESYRVPGKEEPEEMIRLPEAPHADV